MFNNKSDYALNKKDSNAIVYKTADGSIIRLTCEYFASEEEFLRWKTWSDEEYRVLDNREHEEKKGVLSLDNLSEVLAAAPALDESMIALEELKQCREIAERLHRKLSPKQRRRLWLHTIKGKSEAEIAAMEGVTQQMVSKSIRGSKKIFEKILKKGL